MQYAQTLAEIQQEKEALELELIKSASKILADWQNKTGLAVNNISISIEQVQAFGLPPKSIITDCNVNIKYEGY